MNISKSLQYQIPSLSDTSIGKEIEIGQFNINGDKFGLYIKPLSFGGGFYFYFYFLSFSQRKTFLFEGSIFSQSSSFKFSEVFTFIENSQTFLVSIPQLAYNQVKNGDFLIQLNATENKIPLLSITSNSKSSSFQMNRLTKSDLKHSRQIGAIQTLHNQLVNVYFEFNEDDAEFNFGHPTFNRQDEGLICEVELGDEKGILRTLTCEVSLSKFRNITLQILSFSPNAFLLSSTRITFLLHEFSSFVPYYKSSVTLVTSSSHSKTAPISYQIYPTQYCDQEKIFIGSLSSKSNQIVKIYFEYIKDLETKNLIFSIEMPKTETIRFLMLIRNKNEELHSAKFTLPFNAKQSDIIIQLPTNLKVLLSGNAFIEISLFE